MSLLQTMLERVSRHAGRPAEANQSVAGDLGVGGQRFGDLCDEIEADYLLDLRPLFETDGHFHDATVRQLADFVAERQGTR